MRHHVYSVVLATALGSIHAVAASDVRHAGAHVHGINQVQMVLEGNTLQIVYQMVAGQLDHQSMHQVHGDTTQHAHANENHDRSAHQSHGQDTHNERHHGSADNGQHAPRLAALAALENYHTLFHLPDNAKCTQVRFNSALKDVSENKHPHRHDEEAHAGHQDAILQYEFACQNAKALSSIEFEAFETYADLEAIDLEALVNGRVLSTRVTKPQVTVDL